MARSGKGRAVNPVDALEPHVRALAAQTWRQVDEEALAAARRYCDEPVEDDGFITTHGLGR